MRAYSSSKTAFGIGAFAVAALLVWFFLLQKDTQEFLVNAETIPASPITLPLTDSFSVEIAVRDTIDEPDEQPWTLCGVIAGPSADSSDELFPHDSFGFLDPAAHEVAIVQDEDDATVFPQGGGDGRVKTFTCVAGGKDAVHFHYITSRLVNNCDSESLITMQNDPNAEKRSVFLADVTCTDPTAPPKKAGREVSEGTPVPEGFEYLGGQTIGIGAGGSFNDQGYLDRGNPPQ